MSLASQHLYFTNPNSRIALFFTNKTPISLSPPLLPTVSRHFNFQISPLNHKTHYQQPRNRFIARNSTAVHLDGDARDETAINLDAVLSLSEFLCLFSSTVISVGIVVNCVLWGSKKTVLEALGGSRAVAALAVMLVGGVVIGAWIRRRQWRRVCREVEEGGGRDRVGLNLVGRVEKLEEDLRSSVMIIQGLSRQLEKLGIRFRLTRKALKQPMAETAALAQKNSQATETLAVQEDILEKELGEIQKVLLAMQEQQHKQLELILAIGRTGKLFESQQKPKQEPNKLEAPNLTDGSKVKHIETPQTEAVSVVEGASIDKA